MRIIASMRSCPVTVLIVDDDESIRQMLGELFRLSGFAVLEADNGRAGLETACHRQPDLIVCDYRMPVMSGLDMLRSYREHTVGEKVPVILTAGYSDRICDEYVQRDDRVRLVPKPFLLQELLDAAESLMAE